MTNEKPKLNFAQRNGLEAIPEQLKLQQVSAEFRRLFHYAVSREITQVQRPGMLESRFDESWLRVAQDLHVLFFEQSIRSFRNQPGELSNTLERFINNSRYYKLFNLVEFFLDQPGCNPGFKRDLIRIFDRARLAYRVRDGQVIAIGSDEQATALLDAIDKAGNTDNPGARLHLVAAGKKLAESDWVGSVRESIHAVEAAAVRLSPGDTLGPALSELERQGILHGGLKRAFGALYGFTSDNQTGVRHANVFGKNETVDETDALFMLGACASFVSYLISRGA